MTRLRDVNGTVWYVRNGELLAVGNMSQNWARTVLDIPVAFSEDLTRVREILREVAHAVWEDPEYRPEILEEPEVWGVERWDPDGVVVRVVVKTAPQQQWSVARELRERIKDRFDAEGIEIPLPQRMVWHRGDATLTVAGRRTAGWPRRRPSSMTDVRQPLGEGGVERDRRTCERLRHRAVDLGVLGGLDELLVGQARRPCHGRSGGSR